MKKIISIVIISFVVLLFFGCTNLNYSNINNGEVKLVVGESKVIATYFDPTFGLIAGGCFSTTHVLDKSIVSSGGFTITGLSPGETKIVVGTVCSKPDFNNNSIKVIVS